MIKLVIFDLDGTLLNTLDDLADCTNHVLKKHGFPIHEIDAYKYFVGNGVTMLVKRALPKEIPEELYHTILDNFLQYYEIHKSDKTAPYAGIEDTLKQLQQKKILMAVATNKPHVLLPDLMRYYFPTIQWAAVFGNRKEVPVKPNPQIVYDILKIINHNRDNMHIISIDEVLYVGDTAVDMETAQNAGVKKVGVLWGFRTKEELVRANADYIIENPKELINLIQKKS